MEEERKTQRPPRKRNNNSAAKSKRTNPAPKKKEVTEREVVNLKDSASAVPKRGSRTVLPADTIIYCTSAVATGKLLYKSKRMQGCSYEWGQIGDEQGIEFAELQAMRNASPRFFTENWILINDKEALDALNVSQYYKYIYSIEDFYNVFSYTSAQIRRVVPTFTKSLKLSLAAVARQRYREGLLDSMSVLKALEETTGYSIIES